MVRLWQENKPADGVFSLYGRPMSIIEVPRITREQAVSYRLHVNHLVDRLPEASYEEAAYVGLQDTAPRDAILGMHARVAGCEPIAVGWAVTPRTHC